MSLPEDIYSQRILELAANMPRAERLPHPAATATGHSKLCGSRVTIDLAMEGDVVTDYGQSVKACLLRPSAASVMGREVIRSSAAWARAGGAAPGPSAGGRGGGAPPPRKRWQGGPAPRLPANGPTSPCSSRCVTIA